MYYKMNGIFFFFFFFFFEKDKMNDLTNHTLGSL